MFVIQKILLEFVKSTNYILSQLFLKKFKLVLFINSKCCYKYTSISYFNMLVTYFEKMSDDYQKFVDYFNDKDTFKTHDKNAK